MDNFDLIDNYLTNRLGEQEKVKFEERLASDPALTADVEFQRSILEGVKKARMAELKTMLNNVNVGGGAATVSLWAGKIAAGVVIAGLIATTVYLYLSPDKIHDAATSMPKARMEAPAKDLPSKKEESVVEEKKIVNEEPVVTSQKPKTKAVEKKKDVASGVTSPPKIDVVNPTDELVDQPADDTPGTLHKKASLTASHIAVETNTSSRKYNFHYQFINGKLMLYGPFDKSLYEILEIHGDQHNVFLLYKENYYLLNEKQTNPAELQPIKDTSLLRKLKEYSAQ